MAVFRHFHNLPSPPSAVHWNFPPISISMKRIATRAVTGSRPFNLSLVHGFFFFLLRDGPSPKWKWKESAGLFQFPQPEFSVFFSPSHFVGESARFPDWSYFITFFAAQFCFGFVCALFVCARVVYFMLLYFIPACLTGLMGIFRLFLVETRGRSFPSLVEWLKVRRIGLGGVGFEELELIVKNIDTQCWNGMRASCCRACLKQLKQRDCRKII